MKANPKLVGFVLGVMAGLLLSMLSVELGIGLPFSAYVFASVRYPYTQYVQVRFINIDAFQFWETTLALPVLLILNMAVWTIALLFIFDTKKIRKLLGW